MLDGRGVEALGAVASAPSAGMIPGFKAGRIVDGPVVGPDFAAGIVAVFDGQELVSAMAPVLATASESINPEAHPSAPMNDPSPERCRLMIAPHAPASAT